MPKRRHRMRCSNTASEQNQRKMGTGETRHEKHYRRPRRRPAHLRTKTGCLTCRNRKKKCDESQTVCRNCSRGGFRCAWPVQSRRIEDNPSHGQSRSSSGTGSPPKSDQGSLSTTKNHPSTCLYSPAPIIPNRTIISNESAPLFDFLRTVFLRSLVHPMLHETTVNFFIQEGLQTALNIPCLMHALLACCGAEFPVDDHDMRYRQLAEVHYAKAVAGLRADLDSGCPGDQGISLLRTVIMLCIYERSKPHLSKGVDIHLFGAAQLIHLHLDQSNKQPIQPEPDSAMLRLLLEAFIFHSVTSIPFQQPVEQCTVIDSAFSLAERRLETIYFDFDVCVHSGAGTDGATYSPVLGVPPRLFGYIREIALMYQRYQVDGVVCINRCYALERVLGEWEQQHTMGVTPLSPGPRLYILASRILLHRLINSALGTTAPNVNKNTSRDEIIQSLVSDGITLITHLQPSTDYYAEYYCWPILVVGMSALRQVERECLLGKVLEFWKMTRNGTMRRLVNILEGYWSEDFGVDMFC